MPWIRRTWTPEEADHWTREDVLAMLLSPLAYITIMLGTALSLLLMWEGFLLLGIGGVSSWLLFYVIDPKLRAISEAYERKQHEYLETLEKTVRWED